MLSDWLVTQRDQEVHQEYVQVARNGGPVEQQAEKAASAQDEGTADSQARRITQPRVSTAAQLQQPPVHDSSRPVAQPARAGLGTARPDQVHTLVGSVVQSARRVAG